MENTNQSKAFFVQLAIEVATFAAARGLFADAKMLYKLQHITISEWAVPTLNITNMRMVVKSETSARQNLDVRKTSSGLQERERERQRARERERERESERESVCV